MKQYAGCETKFIDTGVNLVGLFLKLGYGVGLISMCVWLWKERGFSSYVTAGDET